jgi:hypothetical protein
VTWFVAHEAALPPQLVPALSRLLLYEARLHPRVRAELLKEGRLPRRLEFRWQQIGERTTVVWELREAVEEPLDLADAGAPYASRPLEEQGLLELAWRVRTGRAGAPPAGAAYRERAERLLAEGRGFEAFLVAVESSFATGETPEDLLGRARDASGSDPRMRAASRALELEQRDPKGALAQLQTLDPTGLEGGDAIQVLRANVRIRLGQGGEALQEFIRALTANPFLLGPWIDAGQLYHDGYRMTSAWACWEAARAIAPGHPLLKRVNDLEASLRRRHPEYF